MVYVNILQLNSNGSKSSIKDSDARELANQFPFLSNNAYIHNSLPRGKNIQEYFDNGSLYTKISNGTFEDLYIGDYWKAKYNGVEKTFRIAGFDTFYNVGNTALTKHHAVIVPDELLEASIQMNTSNTTAGGYKGSNVFKNIIGSATNVGGASTVNQKLYSVFGDHLLITTELLSNAVNTNNDSFAGLGFKGAVSGWEWTSCQAVLMSEMEFYGTNIFSSVGFDGGGTNVPLPLFRLIPAVKKAASDVGFWLRNVVNTTSFSIYGEGGNAGNYDANHQYGVRPRFVID